MDLGNVLGLPMVAGNEQSDIARIVTVLIQQQEGINLLTDLIGDLKAKIIILEGEVRLLRARTDPPKRSTILRV